MPQLSHVPTPAPHFLNAANATGATLKSILSHLILVGNMADIRLRVDSKGRISIPAEVREEVGEVAVLRRTPAGFLIAPGGRKGDFFQEFREAILSEPPRTGKPENWPPSRIKGIWG